MTNEAIEARKEYMREYRKKNKEKVKAYNKKWREEHPERMAAYSEKFWEKKALEAAKTFTDSKGVL